MFGGLGEGDDALSGDSTSSDESELDSEVEEVANLDECISGLSAAPASDEQVTEIGAFAPPLPAARCPLPLPLLLPADAASAAASAR